MRRWILHLVLGALAFGGTSPASADTSLAVHLLGLYDSPMKPASHAALLTDGFGFQFLPEFQGVQLPPSRLQTVFQGEGIGSQISLGHI